MTTHSKRILIKEPNPEYDSNNEDDDGVHSRTDTGAAYQPLSPEEQRKRNKSYDAASKKQLDELRYQYVRLEQKHAKVVAKEKKRRRDANEASETETESNEDQAKEEKRPKRKRDKQ